MRRKFDTLQGYEIDILAAAYGNDEGIYPYGFASAREGATDGAANGTVYRRFQRLVKMGMLERAVPVVGDGGVRVPHELTVLGVMAISEVPGVLEEK